MAQYPRAGGAGEQASKREELAGQWPICVDNMRGVMQPSSLSEFSEGGVYGVCGGYDAGKDATGLIVCDRRAWWDVSCAMADSRAY